MVTEVIKGKVFARTDDAFYSHGPGAMCWDRRDSLPEALWFLAPHPENHVELALIYCRCDHDWGTPGRKQRWNGDTEKPTFAGSIQLHPDATPPGWHGYIRDGDLHTIKERT